MKIVALSSLILFIVSFSGILTVFLFYPLFLSLIAVFRNTSRAVASNDRGYKISFIVVAHNAESIIEHKIRNCLEIDYPKDLLEFFFCSDGSDDGTEDLIKRYAGNRIRLIAHKNHRGKSALINEAVGQCHGDLLIFSDADAILPPDAVRKLSRNFSDPDIGGVVGLRVIREKNDVSLTLPQQKYIQFDSLIKTLESRVGSTTSNDGKLYAVRRSLYRPITPAATDDLYTCLNVVRQGFRFVFERSARAYITRPSVMPRHEIYRRRRIVCRSLNGIWLMRPILNPFRFKLYAVGLFINKVIRRATPFNLVVLFPSSLVASFFFDYIWIVLLPQIAFYALFGLQLLAEKSGLRLPGKIERISSLIYYFCLGNYGTFLGVVDFFSGVRYVKWTPLKADSI